MGESRKQFEEFIKSRCMSAMKGDGRYVESATRFAYEIWQASRAAVEVELPGDKPLVDNYACGFNEAITAVAGRIRAAGLKVKGE